MRLKQLRGLPVIDPGTARKLGCVLDYHIDTASGRLAALEVGQLDTSGSPQRQILAGRIRRIGRDAVILTASSTPGPLAAVDERWLDSSSLAGLEVVSDDGDRAGHLADAIFNQDSLAIESYVLRLGIFERLVARIGRRDRILPDRIVSCSRELMLLSSTRASSALAAVPTVETAPGLTLPLKVDDRLAAPSFEQASEAKTPVAQTR